MTEPDSKTTGGQQEACPVGYHGRASGDAPNLHSPPRFVAGVCAFAEHYDLFLVDQWGVLHDGRTAYPGVVECLRHLLSLGKRVVILSNSGKRTEANACNLRSMGISPDCYTALVTSGEVARERLSARNYPFPPAMGRRCLLLSSDADRSLLQGLDIEWATSVDEATFILLAGVRDNQPMVFYETLLEHAFAHHLPLVCVNPDLVRLSSKGLTFGAGQVARRYEQMGGQVRYIGKPDPMIYEHCRKILPGFESSRVVAVGDSYFHDVGGGARFGLETAFVTGGIQAADFSDTLDEAGRYRALAALAKEHGVSPNWVIPRFRWSPDGRPATASPDS